MELGTLEKQEDGTYLDPATGWLWSEISEKTMDRKGAFAYAKALGKGWKVPSMKQLKTLSLTRMPVSSKVYFWSRDRGTKTSIVEGTPYAMRYGVFSEIMGGTFTPDHNLMASLVQDSSKLNVRCVKNFK